MTDVQRQLWVQIEVLPLDGGPTTRGFTARLAKENGWTHRFADRAIYEYRRFLLLLASGEHPVTPSPVIDQVWHLHLVYTRSYWDDLCGSIAGKPLHHMPSQGGDSEASKFACWYLNTLASYRTCFDSEPPLDIWPPPGTPHPDHRWADARSQWVIAKPSIWLGAAMVAMAIILLMFASGCGPAPHGPQPTNTLNWRGPQFLWLYAFAAIMGLSLALIVRWAAASGVNVDWPSNRPLDIYEQAYLSSGEAGVIQTAVVALTLRGAVRIDHRTGKIRRRDGDRATHINEVEGAIFDAIPDAGTRIRKLRRDAHWAIDRICDRLIDHGLIVNSTHAVSARVLMMLLAWSPVVLGVLKIGVGIIRQQPVGYLFIAVVLTACLAYLICSRRILRTGRGSKVLRSLRDDRRKPSPVMSASDALTMSVALYGMTALSGTEFDYMRRPLKEPAWTAGGNSGGCGGSSCGGSSCGGGGCGGGGCGGCGGD